MAGRSSSAADPAFHLLSTDHFRSEESERRRIARELHDSTAQLLAGLSMNLKRLQTPLLDAPAGRNRGECPAALQSRCVQEGLTNIYKHSGSPLATVVLERDSSEVRLEGMRERAEMAGGRFAISSGAVGTRIDVALPVDGLG